MRRAHSPSMRLNRRAFTLTEVLMASAVAAVFLSGLLAAFIQVLRTTDRTKAIATAVANGRVALDTMATELKQANYVTGASFFRGVDNFGVDPTAARFGNAMDEDADGAIDEEVINGLDDDGDWSAASDRHASVGSGSERPAYVGVADLGDAGVDEDCLFERDYITFSIVPSPGDVAPRSVEITFSLGTYDGREHMLLKTTRTPAADPNGTVEVAPLAEGVLSFSALYWMPNGSDNTWVTSWDSNGPEAIEPPGLRLPGSVHLTLQVYADTKPIDMYRPGEPVKVETLSTVVNIEQIINDSRFPRL